MKKTFMYGMGLLIFLGVAGGSATPAHAASPPEQAHVQRESIAILKQGLDILGKLLIQVEQHPDQAIINREKINTILASIQTSLTGIQMALADYNQTVATRAPQAHPLAQQPSIPQPKELKDTESPSSVVLSPRDSVDVPLAALEQAGYVSHPSTASNLSSDWKNFLWPAVSIVVVLALIFFLRMREKEPAEVGVVNTAPANREEAPIIY